MIPTIKVSSGNKIDGTKSAFLIPLTVGDRARLGSIWYAVDELPIDESVDAVEHFNHQQTAVNTQMHVDIVNQGLSFDALVTSIRLVLRDQLSPSDVAALGYKSTDAYYEKQKSALDARAWFVEFVRVVA